MSAVQVSVIVRRAYLTAEFPRASLLFATLAVCAPVFADAPEVAPESSPESTAPASSSSPAYRFAHDAWASRKLAYLPWSVQAGGGYNLVTGSTGDYMHGRADAAVGVTWFPSPALPLGLRLDGSYGWFTPGRQVLQSGGVGYNEGERDVYGGDLDLQLDFAHLSSRQKVYLLAGVGEYQVRTSLQKLSNAPLVCGKNFCGRFPSVLATESDTSACDESWNAGVGWAMALDAHTSMFVEARYQHIFTRGSDTQFIPVRVGLRF
jgi:hypothetical protein